MRIFDIMEYDHCYTPIILSQHSGVRIQDIWYLLNVLEAQGLIVRIKLKYRNKTYFLKPRPNENYDLEKIKEAIEKVVREKRANIIILKDTEETTNQNNT